MGTGRPRAGLGRMRGTWALGESDLHLGDRDSVLLGRGNSAPQSRSGAGAMPGAGRGDQMGQAEGDMSNAKKRPNKRSRKRTVRLANEGNIRECMLRRMNRFRIKACPHRRRSCRAGGRATQASKCPAPLACANLSRWQTCPNHSACYEIMPMLWVHSVGF